MIHSIPKPHISPNFTIDDLHKIREWNYERTKDGTREEYQSLLKKETDAVFQRMEELKAKKTNRC
ncbi:MAG: hypothetical protein Ta2A_02950 [Treponemataceae bacterium]|nr:MAG: hypothetical protein Ta2A_02950 [Treponemataceae bacterium]